MNMMNLYEFVQLAIWPGEDSISNVIPSMFPSASDALSTFLESWTLLQTVLGPRAIGFFPSDFPLRRRALRRGHRGAGAEAW